MADLLRLSRTSLFILKASHCSSRISSPPDRACDSRFQISRQHTCIQLPDTCFIGSAQAWPHSAQRKSSPARAVRRLGSQQTAQ